jgi:hypothetical protein
LDQFFGQMSAFKRAEPFVQGADGHC